MSGGDSGLTVIQHLALHALLVGVGVSVMVFSVMAEWPIGVGVGFFLLVIPIAIERWRLRDVI